MINSIRGVFLLLCFFTLSNFFVSRSYSEEPALTAGCELVSGKEFAAAEVAERVENIAQSAKCYLENSKIVEGFEQLRMASKIIADVESITERGPLRSLLVNEVSGSAQVRLLMGSVESKTVLHAQRTLDVYGELLPELDGHDKQTDFVFLLGLAELYGRLPNGRQQTVETYEFATKILPTLPDDVQRIGVGGIFEGVRNFHEWCRYREAVEILSHVPNKYLSYGYVRDFKAGVYYKPLSKGDYGCTIAPELREGLEAALSFLEPLTFTNDGLPAGWVAIPQVNIGICYKVQGDVESASRWVSKAISSARQEADLSQRIRLLVKVAIVLARFDYKEVSPLALIDEAEQIVLSNPELLRYQEFKQLIANNRSWMKEHR